MKNALFCACISVGLLAAPMTLTFAEPVTKAEVQAEKVEHPRIAKAIKDLEEAIAYMEKAPHDFGGHKASAIAASKEAIAQLKLALAYRAAKDNK